MYGGLSFDPHGDFDAQAAAITELLCKRLVDDREANKGAIKADAVAE